MSREFNVVLLFFATFKVPLCFAQLDTPLETVRRFYQAYLNYDYRKTPNIPTPTLPFSKSFQSEVDKNAKVCEEYSDEVCGWGADNDVYLDTQDHDDDLSFENAHLQLKEISKDIIRVAFNVFPSLPSAQSGAKIVTFKMKLENSRWVVDDIVYNDKLSSRAMMKKENADLLRNDGKR